MNLTKIGAGTLNLTGANTYSGTTTLSAGTIEVGSSTALGTSSLAMATGTTLQSGAAGLNLANAIGLTGTDTVDTNGNTLTLSGVISGAGVNLTKIGAGTLNLTGANTFSGSATISAGTLRMGNPAALSVNVAVTNNSVLDLNGNSETIGSLAGTTAGATVVGVGSSLTTGGNNTSTSYDGTISIANLTKAGTGNFTLESAGTNTLTGLLHVTGGTLTIGSGASATVVSANSATVDANTTLSVATGATLTTTVLGGLLNNGHVINNGTVNDDLNNNSTVDNFGAYNATVATNTGTIENHSPGVWTGDVTSNSNTILNDVGATWVGNVLANTGTITTAGTWTGNFASAGIVNAQGTLTGTVNNSGQFNVTGALTGISNFTNNAAGVLDLGGNNLTVASLANSGNVNMVNGATNQTLTSAALSGNGTVNLDINLSQTSGQLADKIVVTNPAGFAAGNTQNLAFTVVAGPRVLTPDIAVIQGSNGGTATASGLPGPGIINYALIRSGNDWVVHATANPVLGGIASNISLVESTIGSVVNRPSSPFVSGLAADVEPGHCGAGPWIRGTGGYAGATGTASVSGFSSTSKVDLNYKGAQFGLDIACFNIQKTGIDVAIGVIGGLNNGSTTQDLTSVGGGMTDSTFDQKFAGVYATFAKGPFAADIQARYDTTDFTFTNAALGLNNSPLNSVRYTLSGSASYAIDLKGVSLVPAVGFSAAQTTSSTISAGGNLLTPDASLSLVGFVGATLAKTIILPDQKSAVTPFITATLYNDFAPDPTSTFVDTLGNTQIITSQNLGMVGEGSLGLNYVKILDSAPTGPKQINANVRADLKYSDRVTGAGVTAQARVQF